MDVAFILHAEHEFNASSFAARVAAGTYVDLHSSHDRGDRRSLKGPRHGGANEDVIEMIEEVGSPEKAEAWARDRLQRYQAASREERAKPELRFPGMGHAVYKTWDPRARILQKLAGEVAELRGEGWIAEIQETVRKVAAEGLGLNPERRLLLGGAVPLARHSERPVHQHLRHRAHGGLRRAHRRAAQRRPPDPPARRVHRPRATATSCRSTSADAVRAARLVAPGRTWGRCGWGFRRLRRPAG